MTLYVWTHPPTPKYFFVDGRHPPRPATALDSPIVDDPELLDWTVKSVLAPYNVNYHDYPEQLNTAGRRFTQRGWNTFAQSYIDSGNFAEMKARDVAVLRPGAARSDRPPIHGRRRRRSPTRSSFRGSDLPEHPAADTQNLMVNRHGVRTNSDDHPDGLAVDSSSPAPLAGEAPCSSRTALCGRFIVGSILPGPATAQQSSAGNGQGQARTTASR